MTCYHPIKAYKTPGGVVFDELSRHDITAELELPCGRCIGCRMRRASDWELRVMHEASCWPENSFITLTYAPGNLPPGASLRHRDFQLFLKRLRKKNKDQKIRYYMAGEYGTQNGRPHFHACLFNKDFHDRKYEGTSESGLPYDRSDELTQLWQHGIASVQDLCRETAAYATRYILTKITGDLAEEHYKRIDPETGEIYYLKPEYNAMSLKPGIGATWLQKYMRDVYPHDFVIHDGTRRPPPKYYDKKFKELGTPDQIDLVEYKRQQRAQASSLDNTTARLKDKETVHLAKIRNLKRTIE